MAYHFNDYGWYTGQVADGTPRSTPLAPANTSTTTTPGQMRANFTGYVWANQAYAAPPAPPPAPAPKRYITKLAFYSRFTDAEAITFDLASQGNTQGAAALRRYLKKVDLAEYIDLDRPDTRAGVEALEAATLIGEGRAAEILDGAIQEHEVFKS